MKKLLSILICSFLIMAAFGQTQTNVDQKTCFCCGDFYSLPTPTIQGSRQVKCGDSAKFTINNCPGARIIWSVSPSTSFTGNGTSSIVLTPPLNASSYTITATISCGEKRVNATWQLTVITPSTDPSFTFTYDNLPNGGININTVPAPSTQTPGTEHWWGIQYNGTYPNCNPCASIPFSDFTSGSVFGGYIDGSGNLHPYMGTGITKGTSGYGINYSGFPQGSCVRITHYIKACSVLYRQTKCVSFSLPVNRMIQKPTTLETPIEEVKTGTGKNF